MLILVMPFGLCTAPASFERLIYRVNDKFKETETVVWAILFLINVFTALKGIQFILTLTTAGVMPSGGHKKSPVHHPQCRLYFPFGLYRSVSVI